MLELAQLRLDVHMGTILNQLISPYRHVADEFGLANQLPVTFFYVGIIGPLLHNRQAVGIIDKSIFSK